MQHPHSQEITGSMKMSTNSPSIEKEGSPVAIGGIGGSGTRLVAHILKELGFYLGCDLNQSLDNLWFTLLFKRPEILNAPEQEIQALLEIFQKRMRFENDFTDAQVKRVQGLARQDRLQHSAQWLAHRAESLFSARSHASASVPWACKEPNTHIILSSLFRFIPGIKYIHVIRNGLEVAYGKNQNQPAFWGPDFIGETKISPGHVLKYWHQMNQRAFEIGRQYKQRYYWVNYNELCRNPAPCIEELLQFLDYKVSASRLAALCNLINVPETIGCFKKLGINCFAPSDIAYAQSLGFDTLLT